MDSGENRGVSTVIGFILIFSFLVISFSVYQGVIIPDQNRQAEFQHNERTQGQLLNLQDAVRRTGTTGVSQSVSIQVGVDYPDRTLGVNFATAGGRVSTVEPNPNGPNNITFGNVRAVQPEVRDYWNSSESTLAFPTKDIVYRPSYTRYPNAPETVLSNTAAFNQFDGANLSIADQILIRDNRITIVAINGSLEKGKSGEGASVSVDTEPLSVATNSITIENDESGNPNITLPTTVANESAWNDSSLESEDRIENIGVTDGSLTITLKNGTYSLRMAKVGVGSDTVDEGAEYIVPVDQPPRTIFNETSHEVTVEVRDRFNNPNSSTTVDATVVGSGTIAPANGDSTTDSNGQVTFNYTAPGGSGDATLVFNISTAEARNADPRTVVNHSVRIVENGGGSDGSTNAYRQLDTVRVPPTTVAPGSNHLAIIQVRDENDDPVGSGVPVQAEAINTTAPAGAAENGTFRGTNNVVTKTTNAAGQVLFNYTAPSTIDRVPIEMTFTVSSRSDARNQTTVRFNVTGSGSDGGGGGDNINPGGVVLEDTTVGNGNSNRIDLTLNNTANETRIIKRARIAFYFDQRNNNLPTKADLQGNDELVFRESFESVNDVVFAANEVRGPGNNPVYLIFDENMDTGNADGFFVLSVLYDNGDSSNYFVSF
jgi:hypothetical protein